MRGKASLGLVAESAAVAMTTAADEKQAAAIRAKNGTTYTPSEVATLRDLHVATGPEVWTERLKLIHEAKRKFQGKPGPETRCNLEAGREGGTPFEKCCDS